MVGERFTMRVLCEIADASSYGIESFSPFCLKIHRALQLADLPYVRRHGQRPDSFSGLNPTGQVPVMLEGSKVIADSTNILRHIVAEAPGRLDASPEAWLWEELADTAVNGFLVASRWADDDNWPTVSQVYFAGMPPVLRSVIPWMARRRVVGSLHARDVWRAGPDACWERFERLLVSLDARAPAEGFWCGEQAGVADVALFGQLGGFRTSLTPRQHAMVNAQPRLTGWLNRFDALRKPTVGESASVAA